MIDLEPACDRVALVLAGVTDDQLTFPTPCSEYDVGAVVDHLDGASRGFTTVVREPDGRGADSDGDHEPSAANLGDGWQDSVAGHLRALGEAWDAPAAWQGSSGAGGLKLSNALWGRIALTEVVVHG